MKQKHKDFREKQTSTLNGWNMKKSKVSNLNINNIFIILDII